ncbi:MAG: glutathione peroxidase [Myxococcota bacterium]
MHENREGQRVPEVTFRTRKDGEWVDRTSQDVFAGRTVVVFALPGAFTPTCSSTHLPRYEELESELRRAGVDEVVCLSVNDAFVMDAWGRDQGARHVTLLPDGNGAFSRGMGMLVDKEDLGFGQRSWRYSMLVRDGVIEKMFIEPDVPGDPFEVSDADHMLAYLAPERSHAPDVSLFSRPGCAHCARAKAMLDAAGLAYEEIVLGTDITGRTLNAVTGASTVPQVFVEGEKIGGADDLEKWLSERNG